jgi:hypothetical protein
VVKIGVVGACRGMENIACTKCTEDINTEYREEKELLLLLLLEVVVIVACKGNLGVKKDQSAAAE